jgi:hypothetical protein
MYTTHFMLQKYMVQHFSDFPAQSSHFKVQIFV